MGPGPRHAPRPLVATSSSPSPPSARLPAAVDVDKVASLYDAYLELLAEAETLRAHRNENSKAMKGKLEPERRSELVEEGKRIKEAIAGVEGRLNAAGERQ